MSCPCRTRQFFEDDAGCLSLMRLMVFMAFTLVMGVWIWGNLAAGHYIPLGYCEAGIISAAIAGKAAQARFEYGEQTCRVAGCADASGKVGGAGPDESGPAPNNPTQSTG